MKRSTIIPLLMVLLFTIAGILFSMPTDSYANAPTPGTLTVTNITDSSATLNCYITKNGGYNITSYGFTYSSDNYKSYIPKYYSVTSLVKGKTVSYTINKLSPGTTYKAQFLVKNADGVAYSKIVSFKTKSAANTAINTVSVNTRNVAAADVAEVVCTLNQIADGSLKYNSSTVMSLGDTFSGTRANEKCKGYAKNVFYLCFGVTPGSTKVSPNNHLLNSTNGMYLIGSTSSMSSTKAKNLFYGKTLPGDFVQMRRSHGGSHSAIVYSVSSSGVTFLEANLDGKNTVVKKTYTWSTLKSKNAKMSVYAATAYK